MCFESKDNLEKKIAKLEVDLNASNATLKKFNVGSKALDEIISLQKFSSNKKGLGFHGIESSSKGRGKTIFLKPTPTVGEISNVKFCNHHSSSKQARNKSRCINLFLHDIIMV